MKKFFVAYYLSVLLFVTYISVLGNDIQENTPVSEQSNVISQGEEQPDIARILIHADDLITDQSDSSTTPDENINQDGREELAQLTDSDAVVEAAAAPSLSINITPASCSFGSVTPGIGKVATRAATLSISAKGARWGLTVSGTNFISGMKTIPAGRLGVKLSSASSYTPLTSTGVVLLSNQLETNRRTLYMDYRLLTQAQDLAGAGYSGTVTYTLYAN